MSTYYDLNNQIIYPHIKDLCKKIYDLKHSLYLDNTLAFPADEKFLPGTISSSFCSILTSLPKDSKEFKEWSIKTSKIIEHNSMLCLSTFGILEFLMALYELKKHALLNSIASPKTLELLNQKLDWRTFVDETTLTLKNDIPTNYFGVAFRIALLREELGWEKEGFSTQFLNILLEHIATHSGEHLYMDETNGEGRYDKYTVSIAAELCELLVELNKPIPHLLKQVMQKCTDILIQILDADGNGFSYGRSIGSHGEAVIIETFPVAMRMELFTKEQLPFIYTATYYSAYKIATFWFNPARYGFNIWDDGRCTDDYRNKARILEVNLDISLKMIRAENHLKSLGINALEILSHKDYIASLNTLDLFKYFCFEKGTYERGLFIARQKGHVFSLPIISGGHSYYRHTSYLPIPFSIGIIQGTPDKSRPMLVPKILLQDGTQLMPLCYTQDVIVDEATSTVKFMQNFMCNLTDNHPNPFDGISCITSYTFDEGTITREDHFTVHKDIKVLKVELSFETFSVLLDTDAQHVSLSDGMVTDFSVTGMHIVNVTDISKNPIYHTTHGKLETAIACEGTPTDNDFIIGWRISYK